MASACYAATEKKSYVATEKMTNFNRVSRLLMEPCTDQLRDLLRFYIPPASFPLVIQREISQLPHLTEPQRKLILPNSGVYSGNYNDMDISLLYILLRNVSGIQAHNTGWGKIPDSADRSVSANIERLRLARNQCGHSLGGMCYTEFNQIWSEIKAAVVDLDKAMGNGNKYQENVDFIQNDTMDPARDKYYRDQLNEQMNQIEKVMEMFNSHKRQNEENDEQVKLKMQKLESSQERIHNIMQVMENGSIPPNIKEQHKKFLNTWQEEDKPFHEIHSFFNIFKKVKLQKITTIIGGPGSGKTATARHLALRLKTDCELEIVPVYSVSKIIDFGRTGSKQLFILDDVFGNLSFEFGEITKLNRHKEGIINVLAEHSKIIFTCRKAVYNEALKFNSFALKEKNIVDLEDNSNRLNEEDRSQILINHSILHSISLRLDEQPNYHPTERIMMYPLLCKLFCSESKYRALGKEFFHNPIFCITEQIETMQSYASLQYATLVLFLFFEEKNINENKLREDKCMKITEKVLENCRARGTIKEILDALKYMLNTFTVNSRKGYSLIHDSVYEVLAFHYGKEHQEHMIQDMDSKFVAKMFCISDNSDDPLDLRIKIKKEHFPAFAERLVRDSRDLKLHDVFMNKTLRVQCICNAFIEELKKMSLIEIKELFFQTKAKREKFLNYIFDSKDGVFEWDRQHLLLQDTKLNYNIRAISWVISYGHSQLLKFLFDHMTKHEESIRRVMDLEIPGESGNGFKSNLNEQCRFLSLSCYSGDVDVVKLLLRHCDAECINGSFNSECTPPLVAACRVGNMTVVEELIRHGASIDVHGHSSCPIYAASRYGHVNVLDFLIKRGANCIRCEKHDKTPLCGASEGGHVDVVELLIKHGANCNQRDGQTRTPINEASKAGHIDVVELLIKHGADLKKGDGWIRTPIHAASEAGHVDIVELLIKCRVNVNERDIKGRTPIQDASEIGYVDVVDLLIKHGADCNLRDGNDKTPIHKASKNGHDAVVDLLVKCGADCNQSDKDGRTPLHEASMAPSFRAKSSQYITIVRSLIESGANIDQKDNNGESPLSLALKNNHQTIATILLEHGAKSNPTE